MSTQRLLYVQRELSTCTLCCFSANKQTILHIFCTQHPMASVMSTTCSYDIFSNAISHKDSGNFRRNMALRAHYNWMVLAFFCFNWKLYANGEWRERERITENTSGHFWTSERKSAFFAAIFVFASPDDVAAVRSFNWAKRCRDDYNWAQLIVWFFAWVFRLFYCQFRTLPKDTIDHVARLGRPIGAHWR